MKTTEERLADMVDALLAALDLDYRYLTQEQFSEVLKIQRTWAQELDNATAILYPTRTVRQGHGPLGH